MTKLSRVARLKKVGWRGGSLLAEAALTLTVASAAIALLPFPRLCRLLAMRMPRLSPSLGDERHAIDRARWAVEAAARRLPWRIVCFQKGLAYHLMMRRRGIATLLHYGVAIDGQKGLQAHVWISHRGQDVMGGEAAAGFKCLLTYPEQSGRDSGALAP